MTIDRLSEARTHLRHSKKSILVGVLALIIFIPAAIGFGTKFVQFIRTMNMGEGTAFTILPMVNYLLVAAGFLCLMMWAAMSGMFKDIEGPKHAMLEREEELDRVDRAKPV